MKNLNRAFTLTELLVALGVVSILCAILLPVIFNVMPNQNTMMAKRAYYTVQSVVSDLINDEACYPDRTNSATNKRIGFDDGTASANCRAWNDTAKYNFSGATGTEEDANLKFITLFLDKFGLKTNSDDVTYDATKETVKFKTRDGMYWGIWKADADKGFSKDATDGGYYYIAVDVNGEGSKPNCTGNGTGTGNHGYTGELGNGTTDNPACTNTDTRKNGFDRFRMKVMADGGVEIEESDVWAINAVKVDRNITSDKNSNDEDEGIVTTPEQEQEQE